MSRTIWWWRPWSCRMTSAVSARIATTMNAMVTVNLNDQKSFQIFSLFPFSASRTMRYTVLLSFVLRIWRIRIDWGEDRHWSEDQPWGRSESRSLLPDESARHRHQDTARGCLDFRLHYASHETKFVWSGSEFFFKNSRVYTQSVDWLIDIMLYSSYSSRLIDWLIDGSINGWFDWLIDWLIECLLTRLILRLIDWFIDLLIDWLIYWLIDWLID